MKKWMWFLLPLFVVACHREMPVHKQSAAAPPPKPRPPRVSYLEGTHAADAIKELRAKVGEPFKVLEISIDDDRLSLQLQDPKKRENVDEYRWYDAELQPAVPVRLMGDTDQESLDANVFDPADVDLTKIADLVREANEKVQLEGRQFSGVTIRRNMFDDARPIIIDVDYRGVRKSGYLRADRHGAHTQVSIN